MRSKLSKLLIINTLVLMFFNFAHPVTPEMLQDKQIADSFNGILYALMSLGMVVGSPLWIKNLQKLKSNTIISYCLLGYGISQIFFGFSTFIIIMCFSRFLSGIFASGCIVLSTEYVNQHTNADNKLRYFAYLVVSNSLAGIIGQLLAGILGETIGIYYVFILQAVGLICLIPLVKYLLDELVKVKKKAKVKKEKLTFNIIILMILIMLFSAVFTAYNSQIGYYISNMLHGTSFNVAEINSYTKVVSLIMNIYLITLITKYLKSKRTLILQSIIGILGMILVIYNVTFILLGITLFLIGVVSFKPSIQKYAVSQEPEQSLTIIAYLNSFNALGMVLGSTLTGVLYTYNPKYILYFILSILILTLIIQIINNTINQQNLHNKGE
ncbi:MAG: MFS transporter [Mycoplasmatales bacterium]